MPSFEYIALTATGERVAGVLAGASEQSVLAELEGKSLTPVALAEKGEGRGGPVFARRIASTRQLATAYSQLADLLRAGVPLLRGLKLLGNQKSGPALAKVFAELAEEVAGGSELGAAMAERARVFSPIHVAMVRAGEKGGFLEQVLERMGKFLSAQADLRSKVIGSLIYPSILVVVGTVVLGVVFGVFIPMFRPVFDRMPLGWLTRAVLGLSTIVREYGLIALIAIVLAGVATWRLSKRADVRERMAVLRMRAPVIGPLTRAIGVARFCRVLGTMLQNAIPVLTAMQIARDAAGSVLLERAIDEAIEAVRQGQPMAPALARGGIEVGAAPTSMARSLFPEDVIEMISVGESANNLDNVLITIAETLESRVERMLSAAVKLIEPVMLLVLAGIVATVALSLLLPMARMGQHIGAR